MRKSFLTLMLAIVSSVWMLSGATCLTQAPDELYWSYITVSGTIQWLDSPCEEGEECPPCVTPAIVTSDKTYYLSSSNQEVRDFLDRIELAPLPAIYLLPLQARASGTPYTQGSFDFLVVNNIDDLYVQYFSDQLTRIPSLCDEWNVLSHSMPLGPEYESFKTLHFHLTSDTIINETRYVKLEQDGQYKGAIREGENGKIYFIPAGSAHEYLLYAFNAKVGDRLSNLWYGGAPEWCPNGYNATVLSITEGTPRVFTVEVEYVYSDSDGDHIEPWLIYWTEGVGLSDGPVGQLCPGPDCACSCGQVLLCAYEKGEQVYVSEMGEQYGCEYNKKPINSLCDEWNVWYESFESFGPISFDKVVKYQLTTDTLINGQQYVKLTSDKDSPYLGAMREGNNRDIYYVPAGSTHEYLLYAFNAQEGDQLNNVWLGGNPEDYPYGWTMTVEAIQETNPRTFVLSTGFITTEEGVENYPLYTTWIEGVGFPETPHEVAELLSPADVGVYTLLCAYKNKEQIYVSEMGAEYGCEHDQTPEPTDTIPLYSYTGDDPGSSTVDPVDPNQVVVTLKGDQLTIHESTGVNVTYSLNHTAPAQVPSHNRAPLVNTFQNKVTIQITESGEYLLQLTNPSWDYIIYGQFYYAPQGIDHITNEPSPITTKVIKNGRLFILRGDKVYTIDGREVK